jgi:hypothetical protein
MKLLICSQILEELSKPNFMNICSQVMGFTKCGQTMQVLITTTSLQHLVAPAPTITITKPLEKNYNLILTFNI